MPNYQEMSMLDVAYDILANHQERMNINELLKQTLEAKGLSDDDYEHRTQLYLDITTSSKFVFMGDEEWDLKERQSLDIYDKDGSEFNTGESIVDDELDDEDILDDNDYENDDEYDQDEYDQDEEEDDDDDYEHDENGDLLERYHEDDEDDSFSEDEYNDYMDDYEDMYDDN